MKKEHNYIIAGLLAIVFITHFFKTIMPPEYAYPSSAIAFTSLGVFYFFKVKNKDKKKNLLK